MSKSELAGTYACNYPYGVETLTINSTGTYNQKFRGANGAEITNEGTWSIDTFNYLELYHPVCVDDLGGRLSSDLKPLDGIWELSMHRSLSGSIVIDESGVLPLKYLRIK
ncbi:MAG TPA: hypothetical protein VHS31_05835 [Tepidisphaeraceae bacterium]|jgi:hypothetical protein|nr:hypothetical protein [Tepidisphaeraceae bacterium]